MKGNQRTGNRHPVPIRPVFLLLLSLTAAGCADGSSTPATDEHDHGSGAEAITVWTDSTEIFFEHPPMLAGVGGEPWAIHVTRRSDFSPLTEGVLTLAFRGPDGTVFTTRSEAPVRPGIFTPAPRLPMSGPYELVIEVVGSQLQDRISVGPINVYAGVEDVPHTQAVPDGNHITFLKEQQWPIEFQVVEAREREISSAIEVTGEIVPAAGRFAAVTAPVSGLAQARANLSAPSPGDQVRAGRTLAELSPTFQDDSYSRAKATVERLEREVGRLARLIEAEAIPEKRLVEARQELEAARAALGAMGEVGDGYNFPVRAPISGVVQSRRFTPGQRVEAGETLFEIANLEVVWLQLKVPARQATAVSQAGAAVFTVEGSERLYHTARLVSVGSIIDPESRTLPVILAVSNDDLSLKLGQFGTAQLQVGGTLTGVAIQSDAVLNEDGLAVAYVQTGGETFERRLLTLGPSDGLFTLVERGVKQGEHVVTKGAYQVYLASLRTGEIGDHGHAH